MSDDHTYRGVPVPEGIRSRGVPSHVLANWRRGVDAAMDLMRPMVENLRYDTECSLDHHGYCQEHGHLEPGPCPDGEARKLLETTKEVKK